MRNLIISLLLLVGIVGAQAAVKTGANKEGSMLVAARGVARAPEKETLSGISIIG